jgi:hypothetical protein
MIKTYLFTLLAFASILTACQGSKTNQPDDNSLALDTNMIPISPQQCYSYIKGRDTATLTFMTAGTVATGELAYNLYEKDKNKGIIEGDMRGDTLVIDYIFNAEGKESIRQIALLKKGDELLEGFGDIEEKNGSIVFKNIAQLTFGKSIVFKKINCN